MKLSGAVRNHRVNELSAAAGAANRPVVRTAPAPYLIVNNLMRICIAAIIFMIKSAFRTINLLSQTTRFDNI